MARGQRSGAGPCAAAVALMPVLFAAMGCNGETPLKLNFQSSSLPLPTHLQSPLSGAKGVGKGMSVEKRHIDGLENFVKAAHDPAGFHVMQACSGASTAKRAAHRPSSTSFHRAQVLIFLACAPFLSKRYARVDSTESNSNNLTQCLGRIWAILTILCLRR